MSKPDDHQSVLVGLKIKGRWRAVLTKSLPDGSESVEEIPWQDNRVVDSAAVLIAGLVKKDITFTDYGFLYYAVGEGSATWDPPGTPPTPSMSQTTLLAEFARKAPDYVIYLDPSTGLPAAPGVRTYRTETRVTFLKADGPTPGKYVREQALFGGDATATLDSGIMFNVANHIRIWKDDTIQLQLFFDHTFEIVAL